MTPSKLNLVERIQNNFPQELQLLDQWVVWQLEARKGKATKIPYNTKTSRMAQSDNPATWTKFGKACDAFLCGDYSGVGFMFSQHDPYCGADFDACVSQGVLEPQASNYIQRLDSYSEFSQSGHGVHVIATASLPGQGRKRDGRELYDNLRFFVVTGDHVPGTPRTVNERQTEIMALYAELLPIVHEQPPAHKLASLSHAPDDQALLRRMFSSRNGAAIEALWNGSTAGYASQSDADLALCNHLAFWTGNDEERIDQLFRQSGLMRDKWDSNARNGETYGQGTIKRGLFRGAYTGGGRRRPMVEVKL